MVHSCVLFNGSVSSSDYIASNCDLEGNGRDLIWVGFLYLSGCAEINHEEFVKTVVKPADIRTIHLSNTREQRYIKCRCDLHIVSELLSFVLLLSSAWFVPFFFFY
jgi:hypothetical protein